MPARGFTLIDGDPQRLELFYQTWTLPVRAWTVSYIVQLIYALMMVYTLMKACLAEDANPELFDQMLPSRSLKDDQKPIVTHLKSYCGSTGQISHKQVTHFAEDPSKGELLLHGTGEPTQSIYSATREANKIEEGMAQTILSLVDPIVQHQEPESSPTALDETPTQRDKTMQFG